MEQFPRLESRPSWDAMNQHFLANLTQQVPDGQADVGHEEPKHYEQLPRQKYKHIILYVLIEEREKTEKMWINKKCGKLSILQLDPEI